MGYRNWEQVDLDYNPDSIANLAITETFLCLSFLLYEMGHNYPVKEVRTGPSTVENMAFSGKPLGVKRLGFKSQTSHLP